MFNSKLKIAGIVGGVILIVVIVALVTSGGGSPIDVAMAFYKAGNAGNYEKAYDYLAPEAQMAWEMMGAFMPSFDNAMDDATKVGTITRIEAKETVEYSGAYATVWLTLDYNDGSREQDVLTLIKVDKGWRIYMSTLLLMPSYSW